jgi:6-phosphogluconolactonase (cycloisomerase 2 family)
VETFQIASSFGSLQPVGSGVPTGAEPRAITVEPSGRYLYIANTGSNNVSQYSINALTGELTELAPAVAAGTTPVSIAADYNGKFVYVLSQGTSQVLTFVIDQSTGQLNLTAVTAAPTGPGAAQVVVSSEVQ